MSRKSDKQKLEEYMRRKAEYKKKLKGGDNNAF